LLLQALVGEKDGFLTKARLGHYDSKRNDPNADAVSGLSGYFHFGQLAPQRAALEAGKHRKTSKVGAARCCAPLRHCYRP
jgi:deoxyribodipyrimidine photo-lyase